MHGALEFFIFPESHLCPVILTYPVTAAMLWHGNWLHLGFHFAIQKLISLDRFSL